MLRIHCCKYAISCYANNFQPAGWILRHWPFRTAQRWLQSIIFYISLSQPHSPSFTSPSFYIVLEIFIHSVLCVNTSENERLWYILSNVYQHCWNGKKNFVHSDNVYNKQNSVLAQTNGRRVCLFSFVIWGVWPGFHLSRISKLYVSIALLLLSAKLRSILLL